MDKAHPKTPEELITRLCELTAKVVEAHDYEIAGDCFCGTLSRNWYDKHWRIDARTLEFIEDAIWKAITEYQEGRMLRRD